MARNDYIEQVVESLIKLRKSADRAAFELTKLPRSQIGLLFMLNYHENASAKEVAKFLDVSNSAVTQLTQSLVEKKLVERRQSASDRRITRLVLTTEGKTVLKLIKKAKLESLRQAADSLSEIELKKLAGLHQKLAANIQRVKT